MHPCYFIQGKCKQIAEILDELKSVVMDGEDQLSRLYATSSIEIGDGDTENSKCFKTFVFLHDVIVRINQLQSDEMKKVWQVSVGVKLEYRQSHKE